MSPTTTLSMCRSGVLSLITPQSARTTADRTPTVRRTQNICYAPDLGVAIRLAEPAH